MRAKHLTPSDVDSARRVFANLSAIGVAHIASAIAERRRVPLLEMLGPGRYRGLAPARHELWAVLYDSVPEMSFPRLARIVERDHSTVQIGIEKRGLEVEREIARVA